MCKKCEESGIYSQEKYFTWLDDIFEVNRPLFTTIVYTMNKDAREDYAAWCIAHTYGPAIEEAVKRVYGDE